MLQVKTDSSILRLLYYRKLIKYLCDTNLFLSQQDTGIVLNPICFPGVGHVFPAIGGSLVCGLVGTN
jgi:hypothetical protein